MKSPLASGLSAWALSPGHAGMEGQTIALLEALGCDFDIKRVKPRPPWTWLPGSNWPFPMASLAGGTVNLAPPYPDLIVSCGRRAAPFSAHIAKASGGKTTTVHIQDPQSGRSRFDLLVLPEHDGGRGDNVITSVGSLHRVTDDVLSKGRERFAPVLEGLPGKKIAVLIGGSNKTMSLDAPSMAAFGAVLARAAVELEASLMITASRRSEPAAIAAFRQAVEGVPTCYWNGEDDNPYFGMLGWADGIVVTGDSINMICEACATGKPVYIAQFPGASAKFKRFYRSVLDGQHARFFDGDLTPFAAKPLRETERVAGVVASRLGMERLSD
ncbi:MAG: mitochondrial fission ELM1 family protein [Pseudomonadota bacterium]